MNIRVAYWSRDAVSRVVAVTSPPGKTGACPQALARAVIKRI
jgi:hypothetical protein